MRTSVLGALVAAVVAAGVGHAATPFGGEDTGFVPPDSPKGPITKCENAVGKTVGKLVGALVKCHNGRIAGKLVDEAAEDTCESTAIAKFNTTKTTGCPPCIDLAGLATFVEQTVDGSNSLVACEPGTPWGGEDTGSIPPDAPKGPIAKCEMGVGKAVGKYVAGELACHAARATGKLPDQPAEEACEATSTTKFNATKTVGCTPCVNLAVIGGAIHGLIDSNNDKIYCAQ
jgi:hypothetical protein